MISNRVSRLVLKAGGVAMLCGATAFAQSTMSPGQNNNSATQGNSSMSESGHSSMSETSGHATRSEKKFIKKAYEGNLAEIELGRLAAQKGGAQDVKEFGQKMVEDHGMLNDQLKPIAQQMGVNLSTEPSGKDQKLMKKLQGESGTQFDQTYIKAMAKDHHKDLMEYRQEASRVENPSLKQYASQGEQTIQEHLQLAEQMAQQNHVTVKGMGHQQPMENPSY